LNVNDVVVLEKDKAGFVGPLKLAIAQQLATRSNIEQLDKVLSRYPGQTEVQLLLKTDTGVTEYRIKHRVFVGSDLISEIKQHFGSDVLELPVQLSSVESFAGEFVSSVVVEQTGELFG